jgi:hypothetical protein
MESSETVSARFRAAAEAGDVEAFVATLAPDVVLNSPITSRVVFRGHDEVRELMRSVFLTIKDIRYFADVGDDHTRALFYRARVGREPVEEATRLEFDEAGRVREITLFFRPLPGLAALTAALAPRVARSRRGPVRSLIARLMLWPIGLVIRAGDRLVPWLA